MTKQSLVLLGTSLCLGIVFSSLIGRAATIDGGQARIGRASSSLSTSRKGNVTILMMFPDIDRFIPNLQSLLIVYEYIVQRYQISKWLNVNLQVKDSNCSISLAPHMLVKTMLSTIPDVVFGPFCGKPVSLLPICSSSFSRRRRDLAVAPVARLLHFQNIPLITMGAVSNEFTLQREAMYSTLFRFGYRTDELGRSTRIASSPLDRQFARRAEEKRREKGFTSSRAS